jgi:clan AA aspartic protease (TIGR02281 family)
MIVDPSDRIVSGEKANARRPRAPLLVCILAALAVVAGMIVYLNREPTYAISSEVAQRLDPKMQVVAHRLVSEPCNRTLARQLVDALLEQAEYGAIVRFAQRSKSRCGPNEELLVAVYTAHVRSADFAGGEATADEIVAAYPADPNAYGWRAEARQQRGNFAGAYTDMRTALALFLDPAAVALSVYYDVARLAAKTGHPCEGAATLRDFIAFDPENRRTQQLATIMNDWQKQGACVPLSGTGRFLLRYDPNSSIIIVPATINGVKGRMILDTGASRTYLSQHFARLAGIKPSEQEGAVVGTANGRTWVPGGRAESIQVGGARLADVPIFIQSAAGGSLGDDVDGLLGLSFLGNFRVKLGGGLIELQPLDSENP